MAVAAADPSCPFYSSPQYSPYAYPASTYPDTVWSFVPFPYPTTYVPQQTHHSNNIEHTYGSPCDSYLQATDSHTHRPLFSIPPSSFHRNSSLEMEISPMSPQGARLLRKRLACEAKLQNLEAKYEKEREKAAKERERAATAESREKVLDYQLRMLQYQAQLGSERVVELERELGCLKEEICGLKRQLQDSQRAMVYWYAVLLSEYFPLLNCLSVFKNPTLFPKTVWCVWLRHRVCASSPVISSVWLLIPKWKNRCDSRASELSVAAQDPLPFGTSRDLFMRAFHNRFNLEEWSRTARVMSPTLGRIQYQPGCYTASVHSCLSITGPSSENGAELLELCLRRWDASRIDPPFSQKSPSYVVDAVTRPKPDRVCTQTPLDHDPQQIQPLGTDEICPSSALTAPTCAFHLAVLQRYGHNSSIF
ncbi:hypothetical protein D9758_017818 [Tetrapyrgos nigripes]|uniref:Uncharacterized protein n=1 Tax=Tetrapyrgos nigripes TaxID=182062 RepID=A0A8H5FG13_9AGAR|nr:hypothetical protein D9758_017818 [Tetrapyrgos nigripes]